MSTRTFDNTVMIVTAFFFPLLVKFFECIGTFFYSKFELSILNQEYLELAQIETQPKPKLYFSAMLLLELQSIVQSDSSIDNKASD